LCPETGYDVRYLSLMLGKPIKDSNGSTVGRLEDMAVKAGARFPLVMGLVARSGRGRNRRCFSIPWADVEGWSREGFVVDHFDESREVEPGKILLSRDLLDRQIVDMDGYKIVRVSDIRMARVGEGLRVLGADVGLLSILRRLAPGRVFDRLLGLFGGVSRERIVPWNLMSPVDPVPYDVRLKIGYREFLAVHPSDVADIIEQLDVGKRAKVLALLDDPKAAEVLTQILPGVRSSVAREMGERRLSGLLEIMPPDEAADILGTLPREKALSLLSLMGIEEASVVTLLLGFDPFTAGGRMTTEFVSIPNSMKAEETLTYLRKVGAEAETIYYIYVVDGDGHLSGVLSLRDLLRAAPDEVVSDIMLRDVITAQLPEDQEAVAERLSHYNLLAIPVVDDEHVLQGIVTVDDAIDVMLEEASEDIAELSGVPLEDEMTIMGDALDLRRWAGTMLTFLGGLLGTALFGAFRNSFAAALALVYFVPLALRAAHDASIWSLAVAVREFGYGEFKMPVSAGILLRECAFSLAAAVLISVLSFLAGLVFTESYGTALAGAVGLFVGVLLAGVLGLVLPIALKRVRPDPAVGGRLLGVLVMTVSIISFLVVSGVIVGAMG